MMIPRVKYVGPWASFCYDKETEVLTLTGWKQMGDVSKEDYIATLNPDGVVEYQAPTTIIKDRYVGSMYHLDMWQSKINLLVTPNHNLFVGRDHKDGSISWGLERAESVFGKTRLFKKDAQWVGRKKSFFTLPPITISKTIKNQFSDNLGTNKVTIPSRNIEMNTWLEFLGYYLSEGSYTNGGNGNFLVQLRQSKPLKHRMMKICKKIANPYWGSDGDRVLMRDKQLYLYLSQFGKSHEKFIPRGLLELPPDLLEILYQSLMAGDGSNLESGAYYTTNSPRLRDDFQELLLKTGRSGSYKIVLKAGSDWNIEGRSGKTKHDLFVVNINQKRNTPRKYSWMSYRDRYPNSYKEEWVDYDGFVYCVTLPNHTLYVRRRGCVCWSGNSGYGEANRNEIMALHTAGVEVTTQYVDYGDVAGYHGEPYRLARGLENRPIDYRIKLIHVVPDNYIKYLEPLKYHIGRVFWETDKMPKIFVWNCNLLDEIWTGDEYHKKALVESGVNRPVFVFPQSVRTEGLEGVKPFIIPQKKGFTFYSIFQWIERKNPRALLESYWREFEGEDEVTLVIKTYRFGFGDDQRRMIMEDIIKWKQELGLGHYARVLLYTNLMDRDDIWRFHASGNCFVSAHRGEGWGVPQAEAMAMGKPIISTNLGGIHEILNEGVARLVKWHRQSLFNMSWVPWYEEDQTWAEVDQDDLRGHMRVIFNDSVLARNMGNNAKDFAKTNLSYLAVGQKLRRRLEEIERRLR